MIRVGETLRKEREARGLTVEQVAKATKIRPQFITAIEEGDYQRLPSGAYAQGFVKNYISFLGLPTRELMAVFRREFNEKEYIGVLPESFIPKEEIPLKTVRFNRAIFLIAVIIVGLLSYLFFQYRSAFFNPGLSLTSPDERAKVSSQNVLVSGTTDPNNTVTINGLPALVDSSGHFSKEIPVFPGTATITVKSTNSFGKASSIDRHIIVQVAQ